MPHTPQGAFSCPCGAIHLVSPNLNKAIRGCGPLSTPGFFDRLRTPLRMVVFYDNYSFYTKSLWKRYPFYAKMPI